MVRIEINFITEDTSGVFVLKNDIARYSMYGVPRDRIQEAINNTSDNLQGIYFLVNTDEAKNDERYLYIGKTKQGVGRLRDHAVTKKEWNFAYMFLADKSDMNLQIADELEAYEIAKFGDSQKYRMANKRPNKAVYSSIARKYSDSIEDVLSFFGYDCNKKEVESEKLPEDIFILKRKGCRGLLKVDNGKYILMEGSLISQNTNLDKMKEKREELLESNDLIEEGFYYKTKKELEFDSPSSASVFIMGYNDNGWSSFKNSAGQTLSDVYRKQVNESNK